MSASTLRVEILGAPLGSSPHFEAVNEIIAARDWPLNPEVVLSLDERGAETILAFDEADVLKGVAVVCPTLRNGNLFNEDPERAALVSFLAAAPGTEHAPADSLPPFTEEEREKEAAKRRTGLPADSRFVTFSETDTFLLRQAEEWAIGMGRAALCTVAIANEIKWLKGHGYTAQATKTHHHLKKQLDPAASDSQLQD